MDVATILALINAFPQAITEIGNLWGVIKGEFSSEDQATIDAALATAQSQDAADTAAADVALQAAAKS